MSDETPEDTVPLLLDAAQPSSTNIAPYCYPRLPGEKDFRILRLFPGWGPLRGTLVKSALDDPFRPKYEALSYVWGQKTAGCFIMCDNQPITVTRNCYNALLRIRSRWRTKNIWVDAICINQSSIEERSQQVKHMATIYNSASCVLIWLGIEECHGDAALRCLQLCGIVWNNSILCWCLGWMMKHIFNAVNNYYTSHMTRPTLPYGIYAPIIHNEYWERVWPIQEIAFARNAHVLGKATQISFDHLKTACNKTRDFGFREYPWWNPGLERLHAVLPMYIRDLVQAALRIERNRSTRSTASEHLKLQDIIFDPQFGLLSMTLALIRLKKASDPKDNVFALHSIFQQCGVKMTDPDYSKTVEMIYTETTFQLIHTSKSLEILKVPAINNERYDLPSWVPDWSHFSLKSIPNPRRTSATKSSLYEPVFNDSIQVLVVSGIVVDLVRAVAGSRPRSSEESASISPLLIRKGVRTTRNDALKDLRITYLLQNIEAFRGWVKISGIPKEEHVQQTNGGYEIESLCQLWENLYNLSQLSRVNTRKLQTRVIQILQLNRDPDFPSEGDATKDFEEQIQHFGADLTWDLLFALHLFNKEKEVLQYFTNLTWGAEGLAAFRTGEFLGYGPYNLQTGDSLVLLKGANFPLVIYPAGQAWKLRGPAFVPGLMNGEAWPDNEDEFRSFELI